jgi:hypothetical protein
MIFPHQPRPMTATLSIAECPIVRELELDL